MANIVWDDVLGEKPHGLAVEGKTDKVIIEKFLDAGGWDNWRSKLSVHVVNKRDKVLQELSKNDTRIWGLIDNDERSTREMSDLQEQYSRLLVLPRWTIENYFIDPSELSQMQIPISKTRLDFDKIDDYLHDGIKHGALWHTLYERDAFQFCRGHEDGYPMAILSNVEFDDATIATRLNTWQSHLNATDIMPLYQQKLAEFEQHRDENYTKHIHGKYFFSQVVVQKVLNSIQQKSTDYWLELLTESITYCPDDMKALLRQILS